MSRLYTSTAGSESSIQSHLGVIWVNSPSLSHAPRCRLADAAQGAPSLGGGRAPGSPDTPHPARGTTHRIRGPASRSTTALRERGELRAADGDRHPCSPNPPAAMPSPPGARAPLLTARGPTDTRVHPSYSRRWCFHAFAPSLPPPAAPQGNLPLHRSAPRRPNLAACGVPSPAAVGPSPPYPSWRAQTPLAPHQSLACPPLPSSPGQAGSGGGAAAALPWCFPRLPASGLAAEGGCWGLQQAGGGGGQACAHAAGQRLAPPLVTRGHLSRSC